MQNFQPASAQKSTQKIDAKVDERPTMEKRDKVATSSRRLVVDAIESAASRRPTAR